MSETTAQILVIGQVQGTVQEAEALDPRVFDVYDNTLDGVYAASAQDYHAIVLVRRGMKYALEKTVLAVRDHNHAPIYVLTDAVDEPEVRSLVNVADRGGVRDYLIAPATLSQIHDMLFPAAPGATCAELNQRLETLEKLATEDDLTGLKNRRYIWEFARQVLERARQDAGRVTLMVYDIDDFKHYNDRYGHPTGDRILKEAAELMNRCCRSHDVVGRIGGDEFAVILLPLVPASFSVALLRTGAIDLAYLTRQALVGLFLTAPLLMVAW